MYRKMPVLLCLALLAGIFCLHAQGQSTDDAIKIETRLVSVPVIVSDRSGRYIPGLTQNDFSVFQDGAEQRVEFFAATEESVTIALLIDTSHSTRDVLDDIKDSAKSFVKLLKPADRAMIVTFDNETHILCPLTSDQETLRQAIKDTFIPAIVGTKLRDAVYQTINRSFADIKGRKAIIVLTDGKDFGSRVPRNQLLYKLQESDTLVYTVYFETGPRGPQRPFRMGRNGGIFGGRFPPPPNPRQRERVEQQNEMAQEFLQSLSDMTAGRFYSTKNGKIKKTFATIVDELRFQYRIGFSPPEDDGGQALHELKVKVARPDVAIRARESYRTQSKAR
jgi:VWFA-related protein